jgi:hypothetical protein
MGCVPKVNWVSQRLPHYRPNLHIANFDRTEQGKKKAILLLLCGLKEGV